MIQFILRLTSACPPHKRSKATSGPWVGRCVKCGEPC